MDWPPAMAMGVFVLFAAVAAGARTWGPADGFGDAQQWVSDVRSSVGEVSARRRQLLRVVEDILNPEGRRGKIGADAVEWAMSERGRPLTAPVRGGRGGKRGTAGPLADCAVLWELYMATDGPHWLMGRPWGRFGEAYFVSHCCDKGTFEDIECNDENRVILLGLGGHNLAGAVPASIANLTSLIFLDLSRNRLTSLPPEIASLEFLLGLLIQYNDLRPPAALWQLTHVIIL